ncbi:MAG: hypothetical protein IKO68_05520 [Oscillospiraceae bacterium]|nr:hypothetical protein [Oscillospiraceae bacterium]
MFNSEVSQSTNATYGRVSTFGELRHLLPSTGKKPVPGIKQLKAIATVVLQAKTDCGFIRIYDNGFYTYTENDRSTVYGVDRCSVLEWTFCNDEKGSSEGANLDDLPWEVPLEIAGTNRLMHNSNNREESKRVFSLDDPASENNILFSVNHKHECDETTEQEELHRWNRILQVRYMLEKMPEPQRTIVMLYFCEGKSQKEIGQIVGVSQQYVQKVTQSFATHVRKEVDL